jgi:hypothetical protein
LRYGKNCRICENISLPVPAANEWLVVAEMIYLGSDMLIFESPLSLLLAKGWAPCLPENSNFGDKKQKS